MYLKTKKKKFNLKTSPLIVGILNLTPDSFYDGNKYISKYKLLQKVQLRQQEEHNKVPHLNGILQ